MIEILLANDGAAISDDSYRSLLNAFAQDATVHELLVERPVLPFAVKERLVCLVSKALQARMIEHHDLPDQLVEQLGLHGRERALMTSLTALKTGQEIDAAVKRLVQKAGTPALVSLYERARLPAHLQPAFQVVLEVVLEHRRAGHTRAQPDIENRIVGELVQAYRQISPDGLESVIYQLGRLSADNPDGLRL